MNDYCHATISVSSYAQTARAVVRCGGGPLSPANSPTKKSPTKKRKSRDRRRAQQHKSKGTKRAPR